MPELIRLSEVCCDLGRGAQRRRVLEAVNLSLAEGECLGIVGESGSGKTTLGRILVGLQTISAGVIRLRGDSVSDDAGRGTRPGQMQMVFQDSARSLNPRHTVFDNLIEPLRLRGQTKTECLAAAQHWIERVGLRQDHLSHYPRQLSGGQKQRVCIARAFIAGPELVVCDEAISALDVSVQAQILHLLRQLQAETGVTMVFIAHDLPIVRALTGRILVMYGGQVLESADGAVLFEAAAHPYTRDLIAATPGLDPARRRRDVRSDQLQKTVLSPANSGCVYRLRCDRVSDRCLQAPASEAVGPNHEVKCWHPLT